MSNVGNNPLYRSNNNIAGVGPHQTHAAKAPPSKPDGGRIPGDEKARPRDGFDAASPTGIGRAELAARKMKILP